MQRIAWKPELLAIHQLVVLVACRPNSSRFQTGTDGFNRIQIYMGQSGMVVARLLQKAAVKRQNGFFECSNDCDQVLKLRI